jgi:hypothetical protein
MSIYDIRRKNYVAYENSYSLRACDLSKEQRAFIFSLNKKLMAIEETIHKEFTSLSRHADTRIADPDDWVEDYELDCVVTITLKEDDPKYDPNNDNILIILQEEGNDFYKDHEFGIMDGIDHKTYYYPEETDEENFHCWFLHCLYENEHLGWTNILRIGEIWIDINMTYQQFKY